MKFNSMDMTKWRAWILCAGLLAGSPATLLAQPPANEVHVEDVDSETEAYAQIELLTEAILQIRKHYVEERSFQEIMDGALHGMLSSLDAYSSFLDQKEYEGMKEETSGSFGGIGIQIGLRDNQLTVIAPIEDTPAFRAGLRSGDRISAIDGESTVSMSLKDAVNRLRGPKGEAVTVEISRQEEEPFAVELVRDDIAVVSVKGARMLDDAVAYVRVTQFARPTAGTLVEALQELDEQGMKALILDLRGNPGGLLQSAVDVAGLFMKPGTLVVTTHGRAGADQAHKSRHPSLYPERSLPLVVLVNGGSASASEIVAGALKDHRRALIIGSTTFGKASVQSVIQMKADPDSAVRLTTARYHTPSGQVIHEHGVDPDLEVLLSPGEWRDIQIRRAHQENPEYYTLDEQEPYSNVVDTPLQRALDVLHAILLYSADS